MVPFAPWKQSFSHLPRRVFKYRSQESSFLSDWGKVFIIPHISLRCGAIRDCRSFPPWKILEAWYAVVSRVRSRRHFFTLVLWDPAWLFRIYTLTRLNIRSAMRESYASNSLTIIEFLFYWLSRSLTMKRCTASGSDDATWLTISFFLALLNWGIGVSVTFSAA